ncbi:tubulin polyglutamylase complex subunit 2-like isoform X2 [Amphibalanus amphitrite]|uniref:tubulin polyglutamylase complex subunit 2-like isoform X2 n=1 Tax=Amphibalanus amphitrite TaxID=1232801 RepID=UPI001C92AE8A|nr:tubulin polyglutamylase complex subunit 2-like isoform X2 [Amphibalanus amphitrite]
MEEEKALQLYLECYKDYLSLGLQRTLAVPGVCNVRVETCLPVDGLAIAGWEQRYATELPADLRAFYLATDGLRIAWDYRVPAGDRFEVGRAELRPLAQLSRLGGLRPGSDEPLAQVDAAGAEPSPGGGTPCPRLSSRWLVLELERCGEHGSVCLAHCRPEPGGPPPAPAAVWLLDRSCRWHRLTDTFSDYFRMLLAHLALPQWQWKFTPYGLGHMAKTWMTLIAPHLLPSSGWSVSDSFRTLPPNRVDAALFRSRSKNKKEKEDKVDAESTEGKQ